MVDNLKILYVASEISPFLRNTQVADYVKNLAQHMREQGAEIRILVPKFGVINERRNRLHEVIRLSGINISIGKEERPLIVKVASIREAKLQVYFVDNEDYFKRKAVYSDKKGGFYADNDERIIFFCKGVLETIRQLEWSPNIIHCSDWITSLIPLYLQTCYKEDTVFSQSKTIFTPHNNPFDQSLSEIAEKINADSVPKNLLSPINTPNFSGLIQLGKEYADIVTHFQSVSSLFNAQEHIDQTNLRGGESELDAVKNYLAFYSKLREKWATKNAEKKNVAIAS